MPQDDVKKNQRFSLQKIIFTEYTVNSHAALYYRVRGQHQYDEVGNAVCMECNASLAFNTYFNSLNYYKWNKYTHLKKVFLELELQGKFKIILKSEKFGLDEAQTKIIYFDSLQEDGDKPFINLEADKAGSQQYPRQNCVCSFEGLESFPNFYFELVALSEGAIFHGGEYFTVLEDAEIKPNPVVLGVVVCAHHEEAKNLSLLKQLSETTLCASEAMLDDKLYIYFIGNGKKLSNEIEENEHLRALPNKNIGIAGGIVRGLLEMLKDKENISFTHVLTLKGDATLSPHSILKLVCFLTLLKKEYVKASVAFGVFDAVHRSKQLHSGAFWSGADCSPSNPLFDLRNFAKVAQNEIMGKNNVALWTAACHPMQVVDSNALPLPLFAEASDAEFCLHFVPELITLNGLCVWHSESPSSRAMHMPYYRMRDACIVAAVRGLASPAKILQKRLWGEMLGYIFCLRYSAAEQMLDGFEDFCQGVSWLQEQNPEELHKKIQSKAPKVQAVEKQAFRFSYSHYERDKKIPADKVFSPLIRKLTFNGMLLPQLRMRVLPMGENNPKQFYRMGRVFLYNEEEQTGYILRWNFQAVWKLLRRYFAVRTLMKERYTSACEEYYERRGELRSSAFWKKYLNLDED